MRQRVSWGYANTGCEQDLVLQLLSQGCKVLWSTKICCNTGISTIQLCVKGKLSPSRWKIDLVVSHKTRCNTTFSFASRLIGHVPWICHVHKKKISAPGPERWHLLWPLSPKLYLWKIHFSNITSVLVLSKNRVYLLSPDPVFLRINGTSDWQSLIHDFVFIFQLCSSEIIF